MNWILIGLNWIVFLKCLKMTYVVNLPLYKLNLIELKIECRVMRFCMCSVFTLCYSKMNSSLDCCRVLVQLEVLLTSYIMYVCVCMYDNHILPFLLLFS